MTNFSDSQQKNVFLQVSEGWRSFWQAFKGASENVEGTWYDDAARVIKLVLFFASLATGISYSFSNHIFFGWLGEDLAWYPALLLAIVLELAMVFIGFIFFRGLAKRQTWYEIPAILAVFFLGVVFFFACRWGYKLSSEGQGQLSIMFATKQAQNDTTFVNVKQDPRLVDINAQLNKIDGSIDNNTAAQKNAYSIKWKGRTTEEGQTLAKQAGKNFNALNSTKAMLLEQKLRIESEQDSIQKSQRSFNVNTQSTWSNLFGGYMEIFKIGCIAALAFCAVGLENNKDKSKTQQQNSQSPTLQSQPTEIKRIGFAYAKNDKPQAKTDKETVKTELQPVTTTENLKNYVVYIDDKLKTETQLLQAWVSKLRNGVGNPETAQKGILKRLEAVNAAMTEYYSLIEKNTTA